MTNRPIFAAGADNYGHSTAQNTNLRQNNLNKVD